MEIEVLLSCMNQTDASIVNRANLQEIPTLVINQCNIDDDKLVILNRKHRILNSSSRGLSVSRNLGIQNASGDICVLSDDDMSFSNGFASQIEDTYAKYSDADVIAFDIRNHQCRLKPRMQQLNRFTLLRIASCQISFKRTAILDKGIVFDSRIGSGTGNGAGEENKFLLDCHKAGLKLYYCPITVATLNDSPSHWFRGYTKKYFYNDGKVNRYVMGFPLGLIYCIYYLIFRHTTYKSDISFLSASMNMIKGFFKNDLRTK